MESTKSPLLVMSTFLWIGFVCAISFMEAWLKFQAPGITLPLGLGIGRLVFEALNKVEWVFAVAIVFCVIRTGYSGFGTGLLMFIIPFLILIIQSVWLLPALDHRAQLHMDGAVVASSYHHIYYVAAETLKVICLLGFGLLLFNSPKKEKVYGKFN
jgi:hypothetical protein